MKAQKLVKSFDLPTLETDGKIKTGKFNAVKCTIDEMLFDSTMEALYYCELVRRKSNEIIQDFIVKPTYELQPRFKKAGKTIRPITYTPDYEIIYLDGLHKAIDVKGRKTDTFALKQKLFDFKFPEISLVCVRHNPKEDCWYDIDAVKKTATPKRKKQDKK